MNTPITIFVIDEQHVSFITEELLEAGRFVVVPRSTTEIVALLQQALPWVIIVNAASDLLLTRNILRMVKFEGAYRFPVVVCSDAPLTLADRVPWFVSREYTLLSEPWNEQAFLTALRPLMNALPPQKRCSLED